jgi:hydrogenase maturation protease
MKIPLFLGIMENKKNITILGLGNILIGDDGFGVQFVTWFADRYELPENVTIADGGTAGLGLLDIVTSTDHLIVIDAIKVADEPGSLYRFTKQDMALYLPPPTTTHEVEFLDVISMADLMGTCPPVDFIAVVPKKYDTMEIGISDLMKERFVDVERLLLEALSLQGVQPKMVAGCTN